MSRTTGTGHLGIWAGIDSARRLARRVDVGGGIVLYFSDTAPYGVLLPLATLSLYSAAAGTAVRMLAQSDGLEQLVEAALCAVAGAWLAHDVVVGRRLHALERRFGPLHVQWFYAQSDVGPEAMIGKTAVVATDCSPAGYVRIGGELWRAHSLDGSRLVVGQQVLVRRINGLVVSVEPAQATEVNATGM